MAMTSILGSRAGHARILAPKSKFRKFGPVIGTNARRPTTRHCFGNGDDSAERLAEVEAMQEAMDLYREAQEMSQRQVLQELMQMEVADMAYYQSEPGDSTSPSVPGRPVAKSGTPHPGSIRRVPATAAAVSPIQSFWVEQGLKAHTAHSIARDMVEAESPYCDITLLATQFQRLGRVIPGNVQDMVARDWRILDATPTMVAQHYVQLVQLFPNSLDVSELACKQPKLLYCDDLMGRFEAVVVKLAQLHPSHSRDEARALLIEYPDLMFRMSYYMHVRTLDELPMELQNIMVHTGGGLQALWQYHNQDKVSPRFLSGGQ